MTIDAREQTSHPLRRFAVHARTLRGTRDIQLRRHPCLAARDTVYARMLRTLVDSVGPQLTTRDTRLLPQVRFTNALVLARRIYVTELGLFEAVFEREGRDLPRTIERVTALVAADRESDPYDVVRDWLTAAPPD